MRCAVDVVPYFARAGGRIALGGKSLPTQFMLPGQLSLFVLEGTQFHFLREIPMFARYEIRTQIVAWDHKWVRHVLFHILHDLVDLLSYVRSISPTASSPITNVGLDQKRILTRPGRR